MIHPFRHLRWEGQRHRHAPCTIPAAAGHVPGSAATMPTSRRGPGSLWPDALYPFPHPQRDPYAGGRRS